MDRTLTIIRPDWPAPAAVQALVTTRQGGVSHAPYDSLNLGDHVGDVVSDVQANRARVHALVPAAPRWLHQVHGTRCLDLDHAAAADCTADAAVTRQPGTVCAILTADCLPALFCDRDGTVVAAAHAGWRGLLDGVLEATVSAMGVAPAQLCAWLGPAIGPAAFEVGDEVRAAFVARDSAAASAFLPQPSRPGKWLCDIYALARQRLAALGVGHVSGGDRCTVSEPDRFFSYRRDGVTGRQASLIWLGRAPSKPADRVEAKSERLQGGGRSQG